MTSDLERINSIVRVASGKTSSGELTFAFPEVLSAIRLCTENEIAILGVELFEIIKAGHFTKNLSVYDQRVGRGPKQSAQWMDYVTVNNTLALEFVTANPAGDDHVYVLTAVSWEEFQAMFG